MLGVSVSAIACACVATGAWLYGLNETRHWEVVVATLKQAKKDSLAAMRPTNVVEVPQDSSLGKFDSQRFTAKFHETAADVGLPFDEVAYSLEESDKLPYLRYRVTMTVKTRYLDVRKFIAALASDMPHVSLDSIRCVRETGLAQPLSCDLAFSAFFLKVN